MVLKLTKSPTGEEHWIRPPYRAADYTTPPSAIENWKAWGPYMVEEVIDLPEAGLQSYRLVEKYQRDGKQWGLWLYRTWRREYCVEIEDRRDAISQLEINPVPPERAYAVTRRFDAQSDIPVIDEGKP